jgi:hypothetical protein
MKHYTEKQMLAYAKFCHENNKDGNKITFLRWRELERRKHTDQLQY